LPAATDADDGVTAIETSTAGVTASVTPGDVTPPCIAVMVVEPVATPVAIPAELIVAVGALEEFQATLAVRFWVV